MEKIPTRKTFISARVTLVFENSVLTNILCHSKLQHTFSSLCWISFCLAKFSPSCLPGQEGAPGDLSILVWGANVLANTRLRRCRPGQIAAVRHYFSGSLVKLPPVCEGSFGFVGKYWYRLLVEWRVVHVSLFADKLFDSECKIVERIDSRFDESFLHLSS